MSDSIAEGLAEIGRGIDAANIRERRLRRVLAGLVAYFDYTGDLDLPREEACNCPLDVSDTQCGICQGREALRRARAAS